MKNVYVIYLGRLFVDKITKHPQYNSVSAKDRNMNKCSLRIAFAKAEDLKRLLLQQYQIDLDKYIEDLKEKEKIEMERLKQEELRKYFKIIIYFSYIRNSKRIYIVFYLCCLFGFHPGKKRKRKEEIR